jgi:hypothetical protein
MERPNLPRSSSFVCLTMPSVIFWDLQRLAWEKGGNTALTTKQFTKRNRAAAADMNCGMCSCIFRRSSSSTVHAHAAAEGGMMGSVGAMKTREREGGRGGGEGHGKGDNVLDTLTSSPMISR